MKLHQLVAEADDYDERTRKDGQLEDRLETLDTNIKMFSHKMYDKNADVQRRKQEMIDGKEQLKKFYAGEIARKDVPFHIWDLTTSMPAWGTYGT